MAVLLRVHLLCSVLQDRPRIATSAAPASSSQRHFAATMGHSSGNVFAAPQSMTPQAQPSRIMQAVAALDKPLLPSREYYASAATSATATTQSSTPSSSQRRQRLVGTGSSVVGTVVVRDYSSARAPARFHTSPIRTVSTAAGGLSSGPASSSSYGRFSSNARPTSSLGLSSGTSGGSGIRMSNATSSDNPLATSSFQTMDRPAAGRRRG